MKHYQKFYYFLFLLISFTFINSQSEVINITNKNFAKNYTAKKALNFTVLQVNSSYLQIIVKGIDEKKVTNHIISYYENEELIERKQLSQSLNDKTVMWLTKEQIKKNFFITVECASTPCNFSLEIAKKDVAELPFNEQYSYYITEQNKEMKFKLLKNEKKLEGEYLLEIWSKGNYDVNTGIEGKKSIGKNNNNFIYINYTDFFNEENNLEINGTIGDFINIGLVLFEKNNESNAYTNDFEIKNGLEISDFIDPKIIHSFKVTQKEFILNYYNFNNDYLYTSSIDDNYISFSQEYDNFSYSIQFFKETKYDNQGNNKYFPLINGIYYPEKIQEGTTIGLIPMKPEDNFNVLTYEVLPNYGDIDVSIYECENYPLCHINENALNNSINITGFYKSDYYFYSKEEWGKDITPISKKQNMILITCNKGKSNDEKFCSSFINIKTDKTFVHFDNFGQRYFPTQKFIKKDNVDNYFIKRVNTQKNLYVEKFSGNIEVNIEPKEICKKYNYDNKELYIIPKDKDINITIKAHENSVYLINIFAVNTWEDKLLIGSNYLFNLPEGKIIPISFVKDTIYDPLDETYNYFMNIYYINCPFIFNYSYNINKENSNSLINLTKEKNFEQLIISTLDTQFFSTVARIKSNSSNEQCLFYISVFKKENFNDDKNYGIPLAESISQKFIFKKNDKMIFSFSHFEITKDIKINFKLLDKGDYKVDFKIDNQTFQTEYIKETKEVILSSKDIIPFYKDFQIIKQILLYIESQNNEGEKDSRLEIYFNNFKANPNDEDDDDDNSKKKIVIIFVSIVFVLLIVIIIVAYYLYKTKSKNKGLIDAIGQISFQDENKNGDNNDDDDEDKRESLLE